MGKGRRTGKAVGSLAGLMYTIDALNQNRQYKQRDRALDLEEERQKMLNNQFTTRQNFLQNQQNFNQMHTNRAWNNALQQQNLQNQRQAAVNARNQAIAQRQQQAFDLQYQAAQNQAALAQDDNNLLNHFLNDPNSVPPQHRARAQSLYNMRYGKGMMTSAAPVSARSSASGQMMPKQISVADRIKNVTPEYMRTFANEIGLQEDENNLYANMANAYNDHLMNGGNMTAREFAANYAHSNGFDTYDNLSGLRNAKNTDVQKGLKPHGTNSWFKWDSYEDNYRKDNQERYRMQNKLYNDISDNLTRIFSGNSQLAASALHNFANDPQKVSRYRIAVSRGMNPIQALVYADPSIKSAYDSMNAKNQTKQSTAKREFHAAPANYSYKRNWKQGN